MNDHFGLNNIKQIEKKKKFSHLLILGIIISILQKTIKYLSIFVKNHLKLFAQNSYEIKFSINNSNNFKFSIKNSILFKI